MVTLFFFILKPPQLVHFIDESLSQRGVSGKFDCLYLCSGHPLGSIGRVSQPSRGQLPSSSLWLPLLIPNKPKVTPERVTLGFERYPALTPDPEAVYADSRRFRQGADSRV